MTASLKVCPIYQPHPACSWLRHSKYALYINHIQPVHDCVTQSMPYISTTSSLFMTGPSKYALYINHVQPVYDWSLKICPIYINHIQPVYDCVTQSMPYISTTSSLFMTASLKVCPIYKPHPACSWLVTQSMPYISTTSSLFMTASLKVWPIYQPHPACLWLRHSKYALYINHTQPVYDSVTQSMPYISTTSSLFMTASLKVCPIYQPHPACSWLRHSKYALYINHIQPVHDCVTQSMPYISTTSSLFMTASLKVCPIYQPHPACSWLRHSKYALYINHIQPVHDCVTHSMPYISTTSSLFMTGHSEYALYINHIQPVYDWSLRVCLQPHPACSWLRHSKYALYINHIQPVHDCVTHSMPYISTTSSLFMTGHSKYALYILVLYFVLCWCVFSRETSSLTKYDCLRAMIKWFIFIHATRDVIWLVTFKAVCVNIG